MRRHVLVTSGRKIKWRLKLHFPFQRAEGRWSVLFCASWNTLTLTALESSTLLKGMGIWYDRDICVMSTRCTLHKIIAEVKTSSCCVCATMRKEKKTCCFPLTPVFRYSYSAFLCPHPHPLPSSSEGDKFRAGAEIPHTSSRETYEFYITSVFATWFSDRQPYSQIFR